MIALLIDIGLLASAFYICLLIVRKWKKLDLEARKHEIKQAEEEFKTIEEIEKNYPNYKKNKEYVEKFKQ